LSPEDIDPLDGDSLIARDGFFSGAAPGPTGSDGAFEELYRDLENRYRGLIDRLPAVIYLDSVREGESMIDVSPAIETMLGIPREEWLSTYLGWEEVIHPDDRDAIIAASEHAVETGGRFEVEYRALHRDGRTLWIREDCILVRGDAEKPLFWLGLMLDITELIQTQHQLLEAQTKYGALVEQIPAIVYVDLADEQMTTSYVSPQIEALLGYTQQEYIDDPGLWATMLHPDDRDATIQAYTCGRDSGEPFDLEYRLIARDERTVWFRDSAVVLHDEAGRPQLVQGVMLDITERKAAEERISFLAYHDKLTGLPNRAMFDELLDLALARARRGDQGVAVLSVDIDDFKLVNDSLGHEAGDALIVKLAGRLKEATRDVDLVARPGGDEFLLLLGDLDRTPPMPGAQDGASIAAEAVASRVQHAFRDPFEVAGTELYLTASVGISVFPEDAGSAVELMKNADTAMFRSKKTGPGSYLMYTAEGTDALTRLSLSTRLRKAVKQEQWTLHYQPMIELATGKMYGVEALIRWPEPNGGLVQPGEFIPLAEEMGLIEAIGDWVVEEICRQDSQWRAEGLELEIAFNLSPRQLWQPDLINKIVSPMVIAGMDPSRITVEITESTAMTDPDRTAKILRELHERGLKLAIDDFGTGYSSLARLKHMPVDILKIDRSFIRELDKDRDAGSMVSAMISLADNLGMVSLAEGIETEGEWFFLADRGCALGQGFYFSKPVPPSEILSFHRRASLRVIGDAAAG
jgi:diguanylate cyclase (GGDEF)-like protein/PAS domain S-box-containing protein